MNVGLIYTKVIVLDTTGFNAKDNTVIGTDIPLGDRFFIGGTEQRSRPVQIPFWGMREGQLDPTNAYATLQLGIQYEILKKLFLTPAFNYYLCMIYHLCLIY